MSVMVESGGSWGKSSLGWILGHRYNALEFCLMSVAVVFCVLSSKKSPRKALGKASSSSHQNLVWPILRIV